MTNDPTVMHVALPMPMPKAGETGPKPESTFSYETHPLPHNFQLTTFKDPMAASIRFTLRYSYNDKLYEFSVLVGSEAFMPGAMPFPEQQEAFKKAIRTLLGSALTWHKNQEEMDIPWAVEKYFEKAFTERLVKVFDKYTKPDALMNVPVSTVGYVPGPPAGSDVSSMSRRLPGMNVKVVPFCKCGTQYAKNFVTGENEVIQKTEETVWNYIQHLNDHHRWTREEIADWLDKLHDNGLLNIEFEPWDDAGIPVEPIVTPDQPMLEPPPSRVRMLEGAKIHEVSLVNSPPWGGAHFNFQVMDEAAKAEKKKQAEIKFAATLDLNVPANKKFFDMVAGNVVQSLSVLKDKTDDATEALTGMAKVLHDKKNKKPNWATFNEPKGKKK